MSWFLITIWWYFFLLILGLIFFPLTKKIFGRFFFDLGYPFAKTVGILFLSYSAFILGILKLLPFYRESLFFLLILSLALNIFLGKNFNQPFTSKKIILIIFEEILFFLSLLFWTFIRGQEPSIRGLEKFMDFGFINSILRSKYFPPLDMWLAGKPINYYYFGHLTGATLIKLTNLPSDQGYNLILATLFALGITETFSLCFNLLFLGFQTIRLSLVGGIVGSFLVNLGGNLHPIYAFTKGYPNENPIPFWQIFSSCNTFFQKTCQERGINLIPYWYPNATRFIHNTIHEFPSYSYVVADLHGHVFDIPFVLLTLATLFLFFLKIKNKKKTDFSLKYQKSKLLLTDNQYWVIILLGFLTAIHYMSNAFDGPIYMLLSILILFFLYKSGFSFFINLSLLLISFFLFSLPFSTNFKPFVTGIGVNCSPHFLVTLGKLGPFLFEKGNCQVSPLWMLFLLWGFFLFNFIFFAIFLSFKKDQVNNLQLKQPGNFVLILFLFGIFLITIPEFFYIKDIYPAHFRANTMFKLGYQAFIMMGIASSYVFILFKHLSKNSRKLSLFYFLFFIFQFFLIALYPTFAIPSYYGRLDKKPSLLGSNWIIYQYPEYKEIIDYFNNNIVGQPTILEAQGDSYTDFNVISAYTGLPTVAGWWVHEWLWRGSPNVVGNIIPDIQNIYENDDLTFTKNLIKKYKIKYLIIGPNEKQKYKGLKEKKLEEIGEVIFTSSNKLGKIIAF